MKSHPSHRQVGGLAHFSSPVTYQRGRGFGSVLRSIFRGVVPFMKKPAVKQGLKHFGKAALTAVLDAGQRALDEEGTSFGSALRSSSKTQAQTLMRQARGNLIGEGRHSKTQVKRELVRKTKRKISRKSNGTTTRRIRSRDIFSR